MNELGKAYVDFMRGNLDILRQKIADELFTLSIFEVRSPIILDVRLSSTSIMQILWKEFVEI